MYPLKSGLSRKSFRIKISFSLGEEKPLAIFLGVVIMSPLAPVAQLDRAPAFGAGCREFESLQARLILSLSSRRRWAFLLTKVTAFALSHSLIIWSHFGHKLVYFGIPCHPFGHILVTFPQIPPPPKRPCQNVI